MSEKNIENLYAKIENSFNEILSGDELKNALDFVQYLKENDLIFNEGAISYKDKAVCYMHLDSGKQYPSPWTIWTVGDYSSEHKNVPLTEHVKEIAWEHINTCDDCGAGCSPGTRKSIFGKEFNNVCSADMAFYVPNTQTLECIKKLLEMRKYTILNEC